VLLAYSPADVQDEVLATVHEARKVRRDLARVAEEGIARSEGEVFSGTVTIAVPVMRDDGIVAALGVIAPAERADLAWRTRTARLLTDGALAAGGALAAAGR
jgi:DNA-binding IclR family transcriptional regulator